MSRREPPQRRHGVPRVPKAGTGGRGTPTRARNAERRTPTVRDGGALRGLRRSNVDAVQADTPGKTASSTAGKPGKGPGGKARTTARATTPPARPTTPRGGRLTERRTPTRRPDPVEQRRRHDAKDARPAEKRPPKLRRIRAPKPPRERRDRFGIGSSRVRLRLLMALMAVMLVYVLVVVARIQTVGGDELRSAAASQWERRTPLPADRGTIFDRNGEELALSVPAYSISVNPKLIEDADATTQVLASMIGLTDDEALDLRDDIEAKETGFRYVRRQVDVDLGRRIADLGMVGVNVDPEDERVLPGGDTGRSVIGRTDIDGNGIAGIELQFGGGERGAELGYSDILAGTPGEVTREVAPQGRSIAGSEEVMRPPIPGDDLVLTLDRSIQFAVETAILDRIQEIGAGAATAIVMDTDTGDIYAMATVDRDEDGRPFITSANHAAVNAYEPGSVAKVITIAAGLNEKAVTPDTHFYVPWRREYAGVYLSDAGWHADEMMSVERILIKSSNIGTIEVMEATGRETHYEYLRRFGLGEPTALDFPGESGGILKYWEDLWGSERQTVAYGQGLASTSIQLVSAVNAIANDGTYVAPRLVMGTVEADGTEVAAPPSATHEVITPQTARTMHGMMRQVVCRGTAKRAQEGVENFSIAGKTGTGLKPWPNGQYRNANGERLYYASFVGFFPAEDPQVTVLISVDEPPAGDINRFGGTAAAPVFGDLVPTIAHELGLEPPPDTTPCSN